MKDKILNYLKTKLQGVQNSYLEGVAEQYSKTISEESQIETFLNEGTISAIKFSADFTQRESDRRVQDAEKSFKEKYNPEKKEQGGEVVNEQKIDMQTNGMSPEIKAMFEQMQKQNEALQQGLQQLTGQSKVKSLEEQRNALFQELKVPEFMQNAFVVNENTDIEALKTTVSTVMQGFEQQQNQLIQNSNNKSFKPATYDSKTDAKYAEKLKVFEDVK